MPIDPYDPASWQRGKPSRSPFPPSYYSGPDRYRCEPIPGSYDRWRVVDTLAGEVVVSCLSETDEQIAAGGLSSEEAARALRRLRANFPAHARESARTNDEIERQEPRIEWVNWGRGRKEPRIERGWVRRWRQRRQERLVDVLLTIHDQWPEIKRVGLVTDGLPTWFGSVISAPDDDDQPHPDPTIDDLLPGDLLVQMPDVGKPTSRDALRRALWSGVGADGRRKAADQWR